MKFNKGVKTYFDGHAHHDAYHKDPALFDRIVEIIANANRFRKQKVMFLDIGCGDGSFINRSITAGVEGTFIGLDVSYAMLSIALSRLYSRNVHLCLSNAFNLPFRNHIKFDVINMSSVLHHIIGVTRGNSLRLVRMLLQKLIDENLSDDGIMIIDEGYYLSYLNPSLSSRLIFYGLKMLNHLHLNLSSVIREFQPGLEVNFLTDNEIKDILEVLGDVSLVRELDGGKIPTLYRIFFVKRTGHLSFVLKKRPA